MPSQAPPSVPNKPKGRGKKNMTFAKKCALMTAPVPANAATRAATRHSKKLKKMEKEGRNRDRVGSVGSTTEEIQKEFDCTGAPTINNNSKKIVAEKGTQAFDAPTTSSAAKRSWREL
eukprot:628076-Rhodomonas_salina.2